MSLCSILSVRKIGQKVYAEEDERPSTQANQRAPRIMLGTKPSRGCLGQGSRWFCSEPQFPIQFPSFFSEACYDVFLTQRDLCAPGGCLP